MPVPLPQSNPLADELDSQSLTPQSSTLQTYFQRPGLAVEQGGSGSLYRDFMGSVLQGDGSEMLSKEDAENQYGTNFDGPVSRDYAAFKSQQDNTQKALKDSLARGGSNSASRTWLGFGLTQAAGILDVPGDMAVIATDGLVRFVPIGRLISGARDLSPALGRVTQGVVKGAAFSAINEPVQYALSDEKQNMSLEQAAQSLGAGALFLGITEGLFGHTPLKFYSEDENIPTPENQAKMDLLEDHLQPETKATMGQAAVARSMQGENFDPINDLIGLDPRIIKHEALAGRTLSFDERADVLQSMDDGTYVPPSQNQAGKNYEIVQTDFEGNPRTMDGRIIPRDENGFLTLDPMGNKITPEEAQKLYNRKSPDSNETIVDAKDNKVTLPPKSGVGGFINLEPIVNALTTTRINNLRNTLIAALTQRTNPAPLAETPTLTDPLKNVTTLLQPYEQPKQSEQGAIQAGSSGGTVGGTGTVSPKSETKPAPNKWGGLPSVRAGGASFVARGGRIRFRNTETYEHGSLTFVRGASNKFVVARAPKGTFTPSSTKSFDSFNEAHNWLKTQGFDEAKQVEPIKNEMPTVAPKPTKVTLAKSSADNAKKGFEVLEHEAPNLPPEFIRQAENAQISRQKAINGLRKYGLELWNEHGGWWPDGVMVTKTGETFKYGTKQFDKIFGHARELVENFIHKFRKFHDEALSNPLIQQDFTRVGWMPHQLPKQLDKVEGYRLFTLHNRNAGAEPTNSWSEDPTLEAHAHLTVLRDKEGKPYLAVHEAQGGYSGNIKPLEGMKMIADRIREYAQEKGMSVVLPNSKTAVKIYGRQAVNGTFSRAYSKGGYVRKAFSQAFDSERNIPVTLEKLWNPMGDRDAFYEGLHIPDNSGMTKTTQEINAEEDAKQPGYNQAVNCVLGR